MASNLSSEQILSALEQLSAAELERLVPRVIALRAARIAPQLDPEESKLLARIDEGLPEALKKRLAELEDKRDEPGGNSLSEAEAAELLSLSDRAEKLHAERLAALVDLARLRGTTLPALMDQLGIRFPDDA
jgi:hypothetical protein